MASEAALDDKLLAKYHHSAFSTGVRFIIILSVFERLSFFQTLYYIEEEFFVNCLKEMEMVALRNQLTTYSYCVSGIIFVAAILADSYVDKWTLLKFFAAIGSLSSICIITIAFLNSSYAYSGSFELKQDLFTAFLIFLAFSEILPIYLLTLLLDQIGLTSDFIVDTSIIFTIFKMSLEFADLLNLCAYFFSKGDKLITAYNVLVTTAVPNCLSLIAIFAYLRRLNLTCEPPKMNSVLKAIFYMTYVLFLKLNKLKKLKKLWKKRTLTRSSPKPARSANSPVNDSRTFWGLVIITACFLPFYYLLIMISHSGSHIFWPEYSKYTNEILLRVIMLTCLTFMQLGICPFLYKCGTLSSPSRRLTLCYLIVGAVAVASYCMKSANQNLDPFEFIRLSNYSLIIHNLLPSPTSLVFEEHMVIKSIVLGPYDSHLLVNQIDAAFKLNVINKKYLIDDFYYTTMKHMDTYVVTPFGLEEISVNYIDGEEFWVLLKIICFKIICKGDIFLTCEGKLRRSELKAFGRIVEFDVPANTDCNLTVKVPGDAEISSLTLDADGEDDFIAVVDVVNGTKILAIGRQPDPIFADWAFLPSKVISMIASLVFHIAYIQFVLLEAPVGVRTTVIAFNVFISDAANYLSKRFMMRDYLIDRHAALCAFTIYVLSFLIYAYTINKFHTGERLRELKKIVGEIGRLFSATERRRGTSISDRSQSVSLKDSRTEPPLVDSSRS